MVFRRASRDVESCCADMARGKHAVIRAMIPEIPNNKNPKNNIQIESRVSLGNPGIKPPIALSEERSWLNLSIVETAEKLKYITPTEKSIPLTERIIVVIDALCRSLRMGKAKIIAPTVAISRAASSRVNSE